MKADNFPDGPKPGRPYIPSAAWLEFDVTTVALFVLLAGFALGFTHLGRQAWDALTATRTRAATVDRQFKGAVLVVGASQKSQAAIQLTVSPRGYQSIFVSTGDEAISRLRESQGSFQVAVVDQSAPGGTQALDAIRCLLPLHHVIALRGPAPSAEIAQLLLDVL